MRILIILFISYVYADEHWVCVDSSSYRTEHSIYACGVGTAKTEEQARSLALDGAKSEFNQLCEGCNGYIINPKRTSCDKTKDGYKCYRLLEYTLNSETFELDEIERRVPVDDKAKKFYKQLVKEDPYNPHPYYYLGVYFKSKGKFEVAAEWFKRAIDLHHKDDDYMELFKKSLRSVL